MRRNPSGNPGNPGNHTGSGKNPGFTVIAIFTLALGIGASAAMFSFFDAVLFRPLAYQAPERLVVVWERSPDGGKTIPDIPTFQEWRSQNQVFSHLSAVTPTGLNLTGRGAAERIRGLFVSADYFELLGAQPALGRFFSPDEDGVPLVMEPKRTLSAHQSILRTIFGITQRSQLAS